MLRTQDTVVSVGQGSEKAWNMEEVWAFCWE